MTTRSKDSDARNVRVIDMTDGKRNLGIMPISAAKKLAKLKSLDLLVIAPQAVPPVCVLVDPRQFKRRKKSI